jgi:hypothetical protein
VNRGHPIPQRTLRARLLGWFRRLGNSDFQTVRQLHDIERAEFALLALDIPRVVTMHADSLHDNSVRRLQCCKFTGLEKEATAYDQYT